MTISKQAIFSARLNSIKSIIEKSSEKNKLDLIGTNLGQDFNKLLKEIGETYPEINEALPAQITFNGPFNDMQKADVNYTDLEIFTETTLSLLNLMQSK